MVNPELSEERYRMLRAGACYRDAILSGHPSAAGDILPAA